MAQLSLDALFPHVMPSVGSACPNPLARSMLLRAAIRFCKESLVWSVLGDALPIVDTVSTYEIDRPTGKAALVIVRDVWAAGQELTPKSMAEIAQLLPSWQTSQGSPAFYNQPSMTEIRVFPIPVSTPAGTVVTVRAAFAPTIDATMIDADLVNRYFEPLVHGALSLLMAMPNQPWSNPSLAAYHEGEIMTAIDKARIEMLKDRTVSSSRVKPVRFG